MHSGTASAATCLDFCRVSRMGTKNKRGDDIQKANATMDMSELTKFMKEFQESVLCAALSKKTLLPAAAVWSMQNSKATAQAQCIQRRDRCQHTSQQPR